MNKTFLKVQGLVSAKSKAKILNSLNYKTDGKFGEFLFFDYSLFAVPIGTSFSFLCERSGNITTYPFFCKILMVTQEFGVIYNGIPKGHRTLCHVNLNKESYDLIHSRIPIVDLWSKLQGDFILSESVCTTLTEDMW